MTNVLFVAGEAVPFVKTGGLGDVVGSLPKELSKEDIDVRVILPKYGAIREEFRNLMMPVIQTEFPLGWRQQYLGIETLVHEGVTFYFIDNEYYFNRFGIYGHGDDGERYAYFCLAVLEALPYLGFSPDILHCHDWHTGMIPVLIKEKYRQYSNIKTVFTIHNLAYQGVFPKVVLNEFIGLGDEYFTPDKLEFHGQINFMKAGIVYSDILTTVSPSYAREIQHGYFGENLEGILSARQEDLFGIINGLDYELYNPATDPLIFTNFTWRATAKRRENKVQLQEVLGLEVNKDIPLLAMVTRLVSSKGIDLVACVLEELLEKELQLVVLGTGEAKYHELFQEMAVKYAGKISVHIGFNDSLAHRIYAGSDMYLMPSLFEPCGLSQLIALRYGSIPIVRETGGLKDTIMPYNKNTSEGNGFSFSNINAHDMLYTIGEAILMYRDKKAWNSLLQHAMKTDYSWKQSALKYNTLYTRLLGKASE